MERYEWYEWTFYIKKIDKENNKKKLNKKLKTIVRKNEMDRHREERERCRS